MKRDKMLTELGNGAYSVVTWLDDPETYVNPGANFPSDSYQREIRPGMKIGIIFIDIKGSLKIESVGIRDIRNGKTIRPLPRSILLNRPISEGQSIFLCFEPALDLRKACHGDFSLCMSISDCKSGDQIYISYGEQIILKEVD